MAKSKAPKPSKVLESYTHYNTKRTNLPPMGLVKPENDPVEAPKKKYDFDPHLDPQLQWAGKTERTSFEVPTVSLHVHERIDPRRIVDAVTKDTDGGQMSMFEDERKKSFREAIEFYKHNENWSNRLIAGDSLLVMNSLLEKEAMAGKVQMVYFDPPYGIKYGSNFMPFTNKRDVKDGKDEDLSSEPEMIKAFRDTWELGIHSYLAHIRDRMLLAKELLSETGSVFVQISHTNLHLIRQVLEEVFGSENYVSTIHFRTKKMPLNKKGLDTINDNIIWFSKSKPSFKYNQLFGLKLAEDGYFTYYEEKGEIKKLSANDKVNGKKLFLPLNINSSGLTESCVFDVEFNGRIYSPRNGHSWMTNEKGMQKLISENRIFASEKVLYYKLYHEDFPVKSLTNMWEDTMGAFGKIYAVQTSTEVIQRCLLMTTDPGDLVLDITCGSGTTAYVAEQWGRRWMTCDSSRIALTLAKQRLLTATFDFYQLAHPAQGVDSGFKYKTVPHITLGSIANSEPPAQETLYDQPLLDNKRLRITGPFTVEAVPAPVVKNAADDVDVESTETPIEHTKATTRREDWIAELLKSGVRGKHGDKLEFLSIESLPGTSYMQALGITKDERQERVLICFGPEHAPLEQRIVELAIEEAEAIRPSASILLFCAFAFEEEAAKDIDEANWPGVQLLKVQMNMDLQTDDLKKGGKTNESFWFIGQPDVQLHQEEDGKVSVSVHGFDYYDPKSGDVRSGKANDIAMWMVDPDYDGRAVFPAQVFLPLSGAKDGWNSLAKDLKAQIDEDKMELYSGTVSIPFVPGKKIAVKIIDNRGIESLKIIKV